MYVIRGKLLKEESTTKNSVKVSGIKTTHGSKMHPKFKKQIKHNNLQTHNCPKFMYSFYAFTL